MNRQRIARMLILFAAVALTAVSAQAEIVTETVSYRQGGVELEGYLAYDTAVSGKRPAVLLVHEWWGLNDYARGRAAQLARMGYVAFALDMYGKGKVTRHPDQAGEWMRKINADVAGWRQRALAGLDVLRKDPRTDPDRMAAIGYCFGGATVQQLAYGGADLRGIVSFHGHPIPPSEEAVAATRARILICHGAADSFVKPEALQAYLEAMKKTALDWQMVLYGGAKHSFTNPEADGAGIAALGYNEAADKRSWEDMKQFFGEIF